MDQGAIAVTVAEAVEQALARNRDYLDEKFKELSDTLTKIRLDVDVVTHEVTKLQEVTSAITKRTESTEKVANNNRRRICDLEQKIADLEDRSRRNNVRIRGVPEGAEGENVCQYVSKTLPKWLPKLKSPKPEIMRAHRVGPERSDDAGPRTIICYLLRFTDRDRILQAAREAARGEEGPPRHESGRVITFSADYSNFTISRRREFSTVMDEARKQSYQAFLLFPARLKLIKGSANYILNTRKEAEIFLGLEKENTAGADTATSRGGSPPD